MTPRERTLVHLQRMASLATMSLLACTSSQGQDPGYAVVDPMPMPAEPCGEASDAQLVGGISVWSRPADVNGDALININFARFTGLTVGEGLKLEGAELVSRLDNPFGTALTVKPAGAEAPVTVHLGLRCVDKPRTVKATFAKGLGGSNPTLAME